MRNGRRFFWVGCLVVLGLVMACEGTTGKERRQSDKPDFPDQPPVTDPAPADGGGEVGDGLMGGSVEPDGQHVNFWTRKTGNHGLGISMRKENAAHVNLDSLELEEKELDDAQYGRPVKVRGVDLAELISRYPQSHAHDMVLLHFQNKMVVPVDLSGGSLARISPFLAREIFDEEAGAFGGSFPPITRQEGYYEDPNPIAFNGNKMVVSQPVFPEAGYMAAESPVFPFAVTDTLVGLEFVQQRSYFDQFDAGGDGEIQDGMNVFFKRCQYCHSVSDVGSHYGWDFLKPVPIHTYKKAQELTYHVKYAKMNAVQRGLRMPPQVDVEDAEIVALLKWVGALHEKKVQAYNP